MQPPTQPNNVYTIKRKYLIIGLRNCQHVYTEIMADNVINITRHVRLMWLILKLV